MSNLLVEHASREGYSRTCFGYNQVFVNTGISVRQSPPAAKQTIPKGLFLVINSTMAQLPVVAQM